ncbi:MAG: hypothetical protein J4F34_09020 [Gemmatimonadetes bacterium]|nr:hypothetical protein [Gemmatimonadota bacterium]
MAARIVDRTDGETLRGFVDGHATLEATVYTDGATAYAGTGRSTTRSGTASARTSVKYLSGAKVRYPG